MSRPFTRMQAIPSVWSFCIYSSTSGPIRNSWVAPQISMKCGKGRPRSTGMFVNKTVPRAILSSCCRSPVACSKSTVLHASHRQRWSQRLCKSPNIPYHIMYVGKQFSHIPFSYQRSEYDCVAQFICQFSAKLKHDCKVETRVWPFRFKNPSRKYSIRGRVHCMKCLSRCAPLLPDKF
jgi:hypothetical protein